MEMVKEKRSDGEGRDKDGADNKVKSSTFSLQMTKSEKRTLDTWLVHGQSNPSLNSRFFFSGYLCLECSLSFALGTDFPGFL